MEKLLRQFQGASYAEVALLVAKACSVAVLFIGAIAEAGYLLDIERFRRVPGFETEMAVHTAFTFILIGIALNMILLIVRCNCGKSKGGSIGAMNNGTKRK